ncbi:MAG: cyanophycin synthetase, partial [Planctomycetaceae bacterium]
TEDRIETIPDEEAAVQAVLSKAGQDDLLLVLADNIKRTWKQIIYFNSGNAATEKEQKTVPAVDLPDSDSFSFSDDVEIITDERGVRIAREAGD